MNRSLRVLLTVLASLSFVGALVAAGPAQATPQGPTLRVFSPTSSITEYRYRAKQKIYVDSGLWVSASGSTFEVHRASRFVHNAHRGDPDGSTRTHRPAGRPSRSRWSRLDGPDFAASSMSTVTGPTGDVVYQGSVPFCPDSWNTQRVDSSGPMNPTFPQGCYTNPFTTGVVWGIDQGWAVGALDMSRVRFAGRDGTTRSTSRSRRCISSCSPSRRPTHRPRSASS